MQNSAQQWTALKNLVRNGDVTSEGINPGAPTLPAPVPTVAFGVEKRFRALVRQIKASANYNASIGEALGIEAAHRTAPDMSSLHPEISAFISGNHVTLKWGWGGYGVWLDMCELHVDRGDGQGYRLLAYDTTPCFTDTAPFPDAPARWKYKAVYRVGDGRVGQWSREISITVG